MSLGMNIGRLNLARMTAPLWLLVVGATLLVAGCVDYDEIGENRVAGGRGFPCLFPEDCGAPLQCFAIEGETNNVCSGPQAQAAPCVDSLDCQFRRNDLGLPLTCIESSCQYATDQAAAPTQQ